MTTQNKRFFGIAILMLLIGAFKIYSKGFYHENGELNWFNILIPAGLGVLMLIYVIVLKLISDRKG